MSLTSVPSAMLETYVLDSWPLVEYAKGVRFKKLDDVFQKAGNGVAQVFLSELNLGEIYYVAAKLRDEIAAEALVAAIRQLPIQIVPVSSGLVMEAARMKARHPVSYADAFCAALAITESGIVITGDPDFVRLRDAGVLQLEWLER